jgi:predicted metal-dependent hydrolase
VDRKSDKIEVGAEPFNGKGVSPHYVGFFECFNKQLFFEAHEVLEELWLGERGKVNGLFYKGLIQLAGAFVHLQKHRSGPAAALFRLAQANLTQYPSFYEGLALPEVLALIGQWLARLESGESLAGALRPADFPKLVLVL